MIVVDTSAIMAILFAEPNFEKINDILIENELCMSAGTYSELLIVGYAKGFEKEVSEIIKTIEVEIVAVSAFDANNVKIAFKKWGKGRHPAKLNFGDCFAYALAKEKSLPLLFVGNDFSKTDIETILK